MVNLNQNLLKKYFTLFIIGLIPTTVFFGFQLFYPKEFLIATAAFVLTAVVMVFIGSSVITDPYRTMVEGGGYLALTFGSNGIFEPFNLRTDGRVMKGLIKGMGNIKTVFDRSLLNYLAEPREGEIGQIEVPMKSGKTETYVLLALQKKKATSALFRQDQQGFFIYNKKLKTFITKEFLSEKENYLYTHNAAIQLLISLEEFATTLDRYSIHVMELLGRNLAKHWKWLAIALIIILIGGAIIIFWPDIMHLLGGAGNAISKTTSAVVPGGIPINPKPTN